MHIGLNSAIRIFVVALALVCVNAYAQAPQSGSVHFPPHVQNAIAELLESETRRLSPLADAALIRYDAQGELEMFYCPQSMGLLFEEPGGEIGALVIAECPEDVRVNAKFGKEQSKNFERAMEIARLSEMAARAKGDGTLQVVNKEEQDAAFVHLHQIFLSGVGGAGGHGVAAMESMLMFPKNGKNAIVIQF